jgi:hypothetical protein
MYLKHSRAPQLGCCRLAVWVALTGKKSRPISSILSDKVGPIQGARSFDVCALPALLEPWILWGIFFPAIKLQTPTFHV